MGYPRVRAEGLREADPLAEDAGPRLRTSWHHLTHRSGGCFRNGDWRRYGRAHRALHLGRWGHIPGQGGDAPTARQSPRNEGCKELDGLHDLWLHLTAQTRNLIPEVTVNRSSVEDIVP